MSLDALLDEFHDTREIPLPWLVQELRTLLDDCIAALPNDALLSRCLVMRYVLDHLECVPREGM